MSGCTQLFLTCLHMELPMRDRSIKDLVVDCLVTILAGFLMGSSVLFASLVQ